MRQFLLPALPLLAAIAAPAIAAPPDCTASLTGSWAGKGNFSGFGTTVAVDHRYRLGADGRFDAIQRYRDQAGAWQEQRSEGQWSAKPDGGKRCAVTMTTRAEGFSGSSTTTYELTAPGRFRFDGADFDMVRLPE